MIENIQIVCELILTEANVAVVSGDALVERAGRLVSQAIQTKQGEEVSQIIKRLFKIIARGFHVEWSSTERLRLSLSIRRLRVGVAVQVPIEPISLPVETLHQMFRFPSTS